MIKDAKQVKKPDLKQLICAIKTLDEAPTFAEKPQKLYHQSRFWLFRHLQKNALANTDTTPENSPGPIKGISFFLIAVLRLTLLALRRQRPVLIIEHLRLRGYQWDHGDPYFGLTKHKLAKKGVPFVLIGLHNEISYKQALTGSGIIIPRLIYNGLRYLLNQALTFSHNSQSDLGKNIEQELQQQGLAHYFSLKAYSKRLSQIDADNRLAEGLIKFINPKAVYCVDGYNSNSSFILAANRKNIPTIEYQHGIIAENHIGYSFGTNYKVPKMVLPMYFIAWGLFWAENLAPSFATRVETRIGTYEYGRWSRQHAKSSQPSKGMLFIMQPTMAAYLEKVIRVTRTSMKDEVLGIRYHPKQPAKIENIDNCKHHFEGNLYDLYMSYDSIIGCFSTSLFEAVAMQRKVFYLKEPGYDIYDQLLRKAGIQAIQSVNDIEQKQNEFELNDGTAIISENNNSEVTEDLWSKP